MGSFGPLHWLLLIAVILILFGGRGKISDLMGDFAKGIKSFKKGMADEENPPRELPRDEIKKDTATH
jgi:sec-independent protein translocase protein TatA